MFLPTLAVYSEMCGSNGNGGGNVAWLMLGDDWWLLTPTLTASGRVQVVEVRDALSMGVLSWMRVRLLGL